MGQLKIKENFNDDILTKVHKAIQNTFNYEENYLLISQSNYKRKDMLKNYAYLCLLSSANQSTIKRFNADKQTYDFITVATCTITLNFYGETALREAQKFISLIDSQEFLEEQEKEEIVIFNTTNINKIVFNSSSSNIDRYEIELRVQYAIKTTIEQKPLDVEILFLKEN